MRSSQRQARERVATLLGRMFLSMRPELRGVEDWPLMELTHAQLRMLVLLVDRGPLRMSGISAHLGVGMPTITSLVSKLERKGLAAREHDQQDRRVVQCFATPKGIAEVERFWQVREERINQVSACLGEDELSFVTEALEVIIRAALQSRKDVGSSEGGRSAC